MTFGAITWKICRLSIGHWSRLNSNSNRKLHTIAVSIGRGSRENVGSIGHRLDPQGFSCQLLQQRMASNDGPLKTLFDNMNAKAAKEKGSKKKASAKVMEESENTELVHVTSPEGDGKTSSKRMSIERIYQKKSQLEHILLRPDTYIGSVETLTQPMWVFDEDLNQMVQRELTFVPGLYKIFDEILVNAADNKQRDPTMNCIKIDIDPENNKIKVWNNGRGIPVVHHKTEKMFVPTMIFGHLLTSSNYDDTEKKVTGGRNGYGAKLCNIFSKKFVVETSSKDFHKAFKQTWMDNMGKTKEPTITENKSEDFTAITFYPDLEKFKMSSLDKDTVDLFTRRAYDVAAASKGVKVFLNGKRLPVKNFKDYVELYIKDKVDDNGCPLKVCYEEVNPRWEVAVTMSDKGFQQVSFVNSIATTKITSRPSEQENMRDLNTAFCIETIKDVLIGGRHVDNVADQCCSKLIEVVKKKNKGGINIKPFQVKSHMWIFVNCLIENPTFDSQTKENMTLQAKGFGSKCTLSENFIKSVNKSGIVESIMSWVKFKAQAQLNKKCHSSKHSKLKGIPKLDDANEAGTRNSRECTLILTEGDSAKSLAVAGLGVVGRDRYGVFPLRGKVLNVREATHKQIMDNAEINNIVKIMGLQFKEKYATEESLKTLRYGKIMIMTDQDQDGSHIKGLLINFVHHFWPNLLRFNVVEQFITPIVKVTKGKEELSFYSLPEFEEWKRETQNWHTWKVKYYKGLGTSTSKEAKEYFTDMVRHKINFKYSGAEDDTSINLAFSKKKIEERKEWLTNWMEERKRRSEMGLPELYLYGKDTKRVSYNDFINRELILFSNMDNTRSIPSMVDGFKPGQRKVMFTCFKRNLVKELKVAQLAGSVGEMSAYHHGEVSLMSTIINLAQNFVGSNNVNSLLPIGQFGTRIHGGKDAASPRYIFTQLSPVARLIFNPKDDPLLDPNFDDNLRIEPKNYVPILPFVLVNGAEGIGTGWSTKIPNYDVREIVANLRRLIDDDSLVPMMPSFKGFKGTIQEMGDNKYLVSGEVSIVDDTTIEITELPLRTWTQNYKEDVLEPMLYGTDKTPAMITDYKEYNTDTSVKFVVKMTAEKLNQAEDQGLHKAFKLQNTLSSTFMVLFDHNGCIRRYDSVEQIMMEFYDVRLEYYTKRRDYLIGMLASESLRLDNIARFILEKIDGTIVIENKPKKELISMLTRRGYDSDPVKSWKAKQETKDANDDDDDDDVDDSGPDYNYLLGMQLWSLTKEKKEDLLKQKESKAKELSILRSKSNKDLWKEDLDEFMLKLDEVEELERKEELASLKNLAKKGGKSSKGRKIMTQVETMPSPLGRRIEPRVDTAMRAKVAKTQAKLKRDKIQAKNLMTEFKKEEEEEDEDKGLNLSLSERLNVSLDDDPPAKSRTESTTAPAAAAPPKEKKKRAPKGSGEKRPAPKTVKTKSPSPKKKKRNPWSDESEVSEENLESDNEMDGSFMESFIPRERTARRGAAAKVKYNFESDEEAIKSDSDNDEFVPTQTTENDSFEPAVISGGSDSEEDFFPEPKKKETKANPVSKPPKKKAVQISSDEEDKSDVNCNGDAPTFSGSSSSQSFQPSEPAPLKQPSILEAMSKKPAAKPKKKLLSKTVTKPITLDSSDDEMDIPVAKPVKEKKAAKPKAAPKKRPAKKASDSDISEGEFVPKKKKAAKKQKKAISSDDEDDFFASEASSFAPRSQGGRARKPVSYKFDDDEDDDEF